MLDDAALRMIWQVTFLDQSRVVSRGGWVFMWEMTVAKRVDAASLGAVFFGRSAFTLSIVPGSNYHQGHEFVLFIGLYCP